MTARKGRLGLHERAERLALLLHEQTRVRGKKLVTPNVEIIGCHEPKASLTKTSARPASCMAKRWREASCAAMSSPAAIAFLALEPTDVGEVHRANLTRRGPG